MTYYRKISDMEKHTPFLDELIALFEKHQVMGMRVYDDKIAIVTNDTVFYIETIGQNVDGDYVATYIQKTCYVLERGEEE